MAYLFMGKNHLLSVFLFKFLNKKENYFWKQHKHRLIFFDNLQF